MGIKNVTQCRFIGLWKKDPDTKAISEVKHCQFSVDFNGHFADIDCTQMTEADYIPLMKKIGEHCFDEQTIDCTSVFTDAGVSGADIDSCEIKLCKQPGNKSCVGNASFKGNAW